MDLDRFAATAPQLPTPSRPGSGAVLLVYLCRFCNFLPDSGPTTPAPYAHTVRFSDVALPTYGTLLPCYRFICVIPHTARGAQLRAFARLPAPQHILGSTYRYSAVGPSDYPCSSTYHRMISCSTTAFALRRTWTYAYRFGFTLGLPATWRSTI